ncbi:outer membrane protein assembly factor BamB family protein [Streptomyces lavendulocolor]|uniref:outer membrane protein assembly factor BamB family protein n=1 Tax=Streptomyces lavendulocolor TaxID=67316 RepID=UPI003C2D801B
MIRLRWRASRRRSTAGEARPDVPGANEPGTGVPGANAPGTGGPTASGSDASGTGVPGTGGPTHSGPGDEPGGEWPAAATARRGPHVWADEVGRTYLALAPDGDRPVAYFTEPQPHWRTTGRCEALTEAVRAAARAPEVEGTLRWLARVGTGPHAGRLVAEYREGRPLRSVLTSGTLPLPVALLTARRVASALSALHQAGRHHGGLTTETVLCTAEGPLITGHSLLPLFDPDRPRPGPADVHAFGQLLKAVFPQIPPGREGRALKRLIRRCRRGPAVLRPSMERVSRQLSKLFYGLNLTDGRVREEWAAYLDSLPLPAAVPLPPEHPGAFPGPSPATGSAPRPERRPEQGPEREPRPTPPPSPAPPASPAPAPSGSLPDHAYGPDTPTGPEPAGEPAPDVPAGPVEGAAARPDEHPADADPGPVRPVGPEPAGPPRTDDGPATAPLPAPAPEALPAGPRAPERRPGREAERQPARGTERQSAAVSRADRADRRDADDRRDGDDRQDGDDGTGATVPLRASPVAYDGTAPGADGHRSPARPPSRPGSGSGSGTGPGWESGSGEGADAGPVPDGEGGGVVSPPWTRDLGFLPEAAPAAEGDLLFVAGTDGERGRVAAVGVRDGEVRWEHVTTGPCRTRPLPLAGRVFVADDSGEVWWLDAATGRVVAGIGLPDRPAGDPVRVSGAIWLGGASGRLNILRTGATGPERPRLPGVADSLSATPAVHPGGAVALATYAGPVCLDATGHPSWSRPDLGDTSGLDAVWCGDGLLGVNATGLLFRLRGDGRVVWRHECHARPAAGPLTVAGTVVVVTADGAVRGVDAESGAPRWHTATGLPPAGRPAAADGTVLIAGRDRSLRCLDARTGTPRWTARTGGRVCRGGPSPMGPRIHLGASDCHLYAIDARTGATGGTGALHVHPLIDDKFASALRTPG